MEIAVGGARSGRRARVSPEPRAGPGGVDAGERGGARRASSRETPSGAREPRLREDATTRALGIRHGSSEVFIASRWRAPRELLAGTLRRRERRARWSAGTSTPTRRRTPTSMRCARASGRRRRDDARALPPRAPSADASSHPDRSPAQDLERFDEDPFEKPLPTTDEQLYWPLRAVMPELMKTATVAKADAAIVDSASDVSVAFARSQERAMASSVTATPDANSPRCSTSSAPSRARRRSATSPTCTSTPRPIASAPTTPSRRASWSGR